MEIIAIVAGATLLGVGISHFFRAVGHEKVKNTIQKEMGLSDSFVYFYFCGGSISGVENLSADDLPAAIYAILETESVKKMPLQDKDKILSLVKDFAEKES
jgi:hypothetical protein